MGSTFGTNKGHSCKKECLDDITEEYGQLQIIINDQIDLFTQAHEQAVADSFVDKDYEFMSKLIVSFLTIESEKNIISNDKNTFNIHAHLLFTPFNNKYICNNFLKNQIKKTKALNKKFKGYKLNEKLASFRILMVGAGNQERVHLLSRFYKNEYIELDYVPTQEECKKTIRLNVDKHSFDEYTESEESNGRNDGVHDMVELNITSPTIREQSMRLLELSLMFNDVILLCFSELRNYALTFIKDFLKYRNMDIYKDKVFILVRITRDGYKIGENEMDQKLKNELQGLIRQEKLPYVETHVESGKNVNLLFRLSIYEYWLQSQA